jgi:ABC-2 type transport system permease protein
VKYLSLCIGAVWGVAAVALPGAAIGIALFGTATSPRCRLADRFRHRGLAGRPRDALPRGRPGGLAAVGLFISTLTEQPIAASIALLIFTILSWILDAVPQLGWLHPWLIVHEWMAFGDLLRDPIAWEHVLRGLLSTVRMPWCSGSRVGRFSSKDITS